MQIKSKIVQLVSSEITSVNSKAQVVYILTRIGILQELDTEIRDAYPFIRFFRNWAVHYEIKDTKIIENHFKNFLNESKKDLILEHIPIKKELRNFLATFSINFSENQIDKFIELLRDVVVDMPIVVKLSNAKYTLKLKNKSDKNEYQLGVVVSLKAQALIVESSSTSTIKKLDNTD